MRLLDVVLVMFLASILTINGFFCFGLIQKCDAAAKEYKLKSCADYFIAESFRKTCAGEGFENLNEWQVTCRALWKLDYIGWADASDFMVVDYSNTDKKLMFGQWEGSVSSGEVYCRKK